MLDALGKLPKAIDAFVAGVIELAYLYAAAIARTLARPVTGPRSLLADEERLSSRTVLFASSATLASVRFIGAERLNLVVGGGGTGALLLRIVALYVAFDLFAALASWSVAAAGRQAARSMMRYSLGAALALLAMASMALQVAAALHPVFGEKIAGEWTSFATEGTLASLVLLFYASAATFAGLAARAREGRMAEPVSWLAAAVGMALCMLTVAAVGTLSPVVQTVFGGRWETSSEICELRGGKVRLVAAITNGRGEALAISRNSLLIELAQMLPSDRAMHEALERHAFRMLIDRVEGDVLVVKPGATGILRVEADPSRGELALVEDRRPGTTCQLAANKLPSMLLITSGRRLDHPAEQETTAPEGAAQDELPAGNAPPPVYHSRRATSTSTR